MGETGRQALALDVRIFAGAAELGQRRLDLARHFFELAREYRRLADEAFAVAEAAAKRAGPERGVAQDWDGVWP